MRFTEIMDAAKRTNVRVRGYAVMCENFSVINFVVMLISKITSSQVKLVVNSN